MGNTNNNTSKTNMGCAPSRSHHTSTGNGTGGSSPCHSRGSGSGYCRDNDNAYESSRGASYSPTGAYDGGWGGSWSPVSRGISRSNSNCSAGSACSGGSGGWGTRSNIVNKTATSTCRQPQDSSSET